MMTFTPIKLVIAAGVVIAGLSVLLYVQHLKSEIADRDAVIAKLNVHLQTQNNAIIEFRASAEKAKKDGENVQEIAQKASKKLKNDAVLIYSAPKSTPGDTCRSALDLVNGYVQ